MARLRGQLLRLLPGRSARDRAADNRWGSRRVAAFLLRLVVRLAPPIAALAFSIVALAVLPSSFTGSWLPGRILLICLSLGVAFAVERVARRLLPLAVLLRLTLLFPDKAPSRLKVARQARSRLTGANPEPDTDDEASAAERILGLLSLLTAHDSKTRGHSERVRVYADMLATELKLPLEDQDRLRWAALLHDIGKLSVDPALLNKPGKPSQREWAILQAHPAQGAALVGPLLDWLGEWGTGVVEHHEKYDGSGYPAGISGENISRAGRILAVADAYEVMTAARAYKRAMSARAARVELARCAGAHFDPVMVRAFLGISLPRLMASTGPLGLLAQLPAFSRFGQFASAAPASGGAIATTAAGSLMAASIGNLAVTPPSHFPTPPASISAASDSTAPAPIAKTAAPRNAATSPAPLRTALAPREVPATSVPTPTPEASPTVVATETPLPQASPAISPSPAETVSPTPSPSSSPTTPPPPPANPPDAPDAVAATAGDGQVTLSWAAPSDNGSPISAYTVTVLDGSTVVDSRAVPASATTYTVSGLSNGTAYTFAVAATNGAGASSATSSSPVVPAGVPAAVPAVTAAAGDGEVWIFWTAPADNGSALSSYTIRARSGGAVVGTWAVAASQVSFLATGLTNGYAYSFTVTATNGVGASQETFSSPVTPIAPPALAAAPSAPVAAAVTGGFESATATWSAPSDGGSPLTAYTVTAATGGSTAGIWTVPPVQTSFTATGLIPGAAYSFTVVAQNAVGDSPAASAGSATPIGPPNPVSGVSAAAGVGQATVTWTAPVGDGGSPITGYVITPSGPAGALSPITVSAGTTTVTIPGLADGSAYTFAVRARTAYADSTPVSSAPVIPTSPPPTGVSGDPDNASATISWTAPSGLATVYTYTVRAYQAGTLVTTATVAAPQTTAIVSGLANGTAYTFTVMAATDAGPTAPSAPSSSVTPAAPLLGLGVPANPKNVVATPGSASATVTWAAPTGLLQAPITSYLVSVYDASDKATGQTFLVNGSTTTATLTGLPSGQKFKFKVQATNMAGSSLGAKTANITIG
jgi:titin